MRLNICCVGGRVEAVAYVLVCIGCDGGFGEWVRCARRLICLKRGRRGVRCILVENGGEMGKIEVRKHKQA